MKVCGKGNSKGYHMCEIIVLSQDGMITQHQKLETSETVHRCLCGKTWTEQEWRQEYGY